MEAIALRIRLAARVFPRAIAWRPLPPKRRTLARCAWRCSRARLRRQPASRSSQRLARIGRRLEQLRATVRAARAASGEFVGRDEVADFVGDGEAQAVF